MGRSAFQDAPGRAGASGGVNTRPSLESWQGGQQAHAAGRNCGLAPVSASNHASLDQRLSGLAGMVEHETQIDPHLARQKAKAPFVAPENVGGQRAHGRQFLASQELRRRGRLVSIWHIRGPGGTSEPSTALRRYHGPLARWGNGLWRFWLKWSEAPEGATAVAA